MVVHCAYRWQLAEESLLQSLCSSQRCAVVRWQPVELRMHNILADQASALATHLGAALAADGGADQLDGVRDAPRDLLVPPLGPLRTKLGFRAWVWDCI